MSNTVASIADKKTRLSTFLPTELDGSVTYLLLSDSIQYGASNASSFTYSARSTLALLTALTGKQRKGIMRKTLIDY